MIPERRKRARRTGTPLVVLYADFDGLKALNDTHGHACGDRALVGVADALREAFRETDLIARLGGDEFCVVAEAEASPDPAALCARLDEALVEAGLAVGETPEPELRRRAHGLARPRGPGRTAHARRHADVRGQTCPTGGRATSRREKMAGRGVTRWCVRRSRRRGLAGARGTRAGKEPR